MKRLFFLFIFYLLIVLFARSAGAQTFYAVDSAEMVQSRLAMTIGSGMAVPIKAVILTGDGAKFARIGLPIEIMLSPYKDSSLYQSFELDSVSAVLGDTLVISKRKLVNSQQLQWNNGTLVQVVVANGVIVKQLQRRIGALGVQLPDTTGHAEQYLAVKHLGLQWTTVAGGGVASFNTRTGAVVPVNGDYAFSQIGGVAGVLQGGTGLNAVTANKLLYGSATNTIGQLGLGTGLSISSGVLNVGLAAFSTTNLAEGSNLYYTDARARAALSANTPITYNSSTGVFDITTATSITNGKLLAADWITFNGKQDALTLPLTIANGGTGQSTRAAALKALVPDTTGQTLNVLGVQAGGGIGWVAGGGGGGSGTVTSVGISGPSIITWTNTPVTTSGTLSGTLANQTANLLLAGPTSGGAAAPTFRSMVTADIPNSTVTNVKLANSSVTVTAGTGMSGGGSVSLGGSVTLTNAGVTSAIAGTGVGVSGATGAVTFTNTGVTSLTGTSNQVNVSASTGGVTLSTPQDIGTGSSPTFASETLTNATNQLVLGTTNTTTLSATAPSASRIYTFPDVAADANVVLTQGTQSISGQKTFGSTIIGSITGNSGTVTNGVYTVGTNTLTGLQNLKKDNIKTTYTTALDLENTTASDATNTVQQSPTLEFDSHVWNTTSTAMDSLVNARITLVPTTGTTTGGALRFDFGNTGGGYTNVAALSNLGALTLSTPLSIANGGTGQTTANDALNALLPSQGGNSGKVLTTDATNASWVALSGVSVTSFNGRTGAVVPVAGDYTETLGGTGQTSYTTGDILYASGTNTLSKLAVGASTTVLHGGTTPSYSAIVNGDITNGTIANAKLANSSITIQGSAISLGGSTLATTATPQFATLGLGVAADATIPFLTAQTSATTNALVSNAQYSLSSSGTPAANFGMQNTYRLDDNTTANQNAGREIWEWTTATHASHVSQYRMQLSTAGAALANVLTITGAGNGTFVGTLAASNLSGTNTGDQTITLTGDVTGSGTGSFAATIANLAVTNAKIANSTIDLTAKVTGTLPSGNGGTANAFTKFSGPASSEKTFMLPNASATVLTDNALVTVAQGGTGVGTGTAHSIPIFEGTSALANTGAGTSGQVLTSNGASSDPTWQASASGMTNPMTTIGDEIYSSDNSGTPARLAIGSANQVLGVSSGIPAYVTLGVDATMVGNGRGTSFGVDLTHANTWTGLQTEHQAGIGVTSTDGLIVTNNTAAAVGAQQWSPRLRLTGQGWKTNATAASQTVDWIIENQTIQGTAQPDSKLVISSQTAAGGYNVALALQPGINGATGELDIGSATDIVANVYLGNGKSAATVTGVTIQETQVTGSNQFGSDMVIVAGPSTGNKVGGTLYLRGTFQGSSGSSSNTQNNFLKLVPSGTAATTAVVTATLGGASTSTGKLELANVTNSNTFTITPASPSASRTLTIQDPGAAADFLLQTASHTTANEIVTATTTSGALTTSSILATTDLTFPTGATRTIKIADASSGNGGDQLWVRAAAGTGTNMSGGILRLYGGAGTGNATVSGDVYLLIAIPGASGSTAQTLHPALLIEGSGVDGTSGLETFKFGDPGNEDMNLVISNRTNTNSYTLSNIAPAASRTYTLRDAGAAADFLMETADLSANTYAVMTTSTRGKLTSVAPNTYSAAPGNPTGTSSSTAKMMGLAGAFTPNNTGTVEFVVTCNLNSGATGNPVVQMYYGTGTAPANGATVTGTLIGFAAKEVGLANGAVPSTLIGIATGLTSGTAYWFDVSLKSDGTSIASLTDMYVQAMEIK